MVRAVKSKTVRSLAKGQQALLLPGPTGAEPWEVWVFGGKEGAGLVQVCQTPLDNRLRRSSTLALPVAQVFCLSLWLNETDPRQLSGMIPLQVELRGLQPRGGDTVYDWSIVAREANRTLVLVGVLPGTLAREIQAESYETFDLSARHLPFPADSIILWKEQDRLALAIMRGPNLLYHQALTEGELTERVLQDVSCARATLLMQDVLLPLKQVVLWAPASTEQAKALGELLHLPVRTAERPAPIMPAPAWKLTPGVVGEARRAREARRWQRQAIIVAGLLYVLFAGWMVTQWILSTNRVNALTVWQTTHAQQVAAVRDGRAAWKQLDPVVDTQNYPLELLLHVSQAIPSEQLHLTLFETNPGHILIKGEARNVAGAFLFLNRLKTDPYFSSYTLEMGNPRPLPNDLAQFQIEGARATTD